ncbi:SPla/RYanodine receptor SPRY [Penicillium brevicompactum]|uniref:Protein SSH4 n=1 Tax=Penicillium brevicompactum TaxID=5074 RepID=A0A9W9R197_PENBR|nr:SPla/RYanodine receptor SPRY [Penicillium brevicompactum]
MQGPEVPSSALADLPSTLRTVIGSPTTSPIGSTLPLQTDPLLSQQQIHENLQNVLSSFSQIRPEPGLIASGNSTGSTGKGILIGILSAFGSAAVAFVVLAIFFFFKYTRRGRIMLDRIGRPGEFDDEQAFAREEETALESMDDLARSEYLRAKAFVQGNPPESVQTDISLSQFLAIQEKGVSAWEFQPELEIANCFVEARTEIEFYDSECSVQTNLPLPKQNEVYYWEAKIYDKPDSTMIGIGVTTKPYPLFRMPGFHKSSVAYQSTGHRRVNQPFNPTPYGPPLLQGDVIGVGYRPRSGTVFFTRNGKKLEDVAHNYRSQNLFPTIGANGPCTIHVNFGQMGFVFIEGNVKKWGLAPMTGSLAPPPPYGSEQGSILLESGRESAAQISQRVYQNANYAASGSSVRIPPVPSPGPARSPTDISLAQLNHIPPLEDAGEGSSRYALGDEEANVGMVHDEHHEAPPPEYSSPDGSRRGSDTSLDFPSRGALEEHGSPTDDSMDSAGQYLPSYETAVEGDTDEHHPSGQ